MRIRAFTTFPAAVLVVVLVVVLAGTLLAGLVVAPPTAVAGAAHRSTTTIGIAIVPAAMPAAGPDEDDTTRPTINEFFPEERPLSDCLSSLPKPNCGSEARGGWAQATVLLAIVAGLAFIAWRVVSGARRSRRDRSSQSSSGPARAVTGGTRDATTARDGDGGDPGP